ncbi:extracellular solute-binding protein [Bifidobacterium saguinibicoloris]|uniref:extracellular solute-binding protein n=1 Tax=Bifidobacterium saguinibicoloris TaxID=2834433 RepID=UPI001C55A2A8|nr:extracellular solute-binding protein [Bifidobacterium saguinibicoloris]MBW3081312.1 extracellular solute-binding protein [Bifidobacterium saguinibicoloris]
MINWKKAIGLAAATAMLLPLAACGSDNDSNGGSSDGGAITLKVWAPQEDQDGKNSWLSQVEAGFEKAHPEYQITWKNDVVSEGDASKTVQTDPSSAADVYMFASDQLGTLIDSGAIGQLGTDAAKQVKEQNGDLEVSSVTGPDGILYGVPYTGNTWFMYYDKSAFSEEDVKSLDTMVSKAAVAFPLSNSWYIGGFYDGLSLFGEKGNNAKAGMVFPKDSADITTYLANLVANPNFHDSADNSGLSELQAGTVKAYFSGTWDAATIQKALGGNYAATQLPTFTVNGQTKQMKSFAATKAAAYNPNASNPKAAAQFAAYLGSTEAQKLHYEARQIPPTDKSLSDLTTDDIAAKAQADTMANTAILQSGLSGMNDWWTPAETFGKALVNKEVTADNAQAKTDDWVKQVGKYAE